MTGYNRIPTKESPLTVWALIAATAVVVFCVLATLLIAVMA